MEAEDAFAALEVLLGSDKWFFGTSKPSLFDASVFAYTHLLMDYKMNWVETHLKDSLLQQKGLVKHHDRILKTYFADIESEG